MNAPFIELCQQNEFLSKLDSKYSSAKKMKIACVEKKLSKFKFLVGLKFSCFNDKKEFVLKPVM